MECLAAQIVKEFKGGAGFFYLYPAGTTADECGAEYTYIITRRDYNLMIEISRLNTVIYSGPVDKFNPE